MINIRVDNKKKSTISSKLINSILFMLNQTIPFSPDIFISDIGKFQLWTLANSIKLNNRSNFSMQEMQDALGYGMRTIQKHMSSNLFYHREEQIELGYTKDSDYVWFKDKNLYHYDENRTTIYSLFPKPFDEVKNILGFIRELSLVEISPEELHRDNVKVTHITATEYILRNQKIEYQSSLQTDKLILDTESIFSDVDNVKGVLNTNREELVLLNGDVVNTKTSVTQKEIANYLGKSIGYVSRNLRNADIDTKIVYATTEELNKKVGKYFKENPDKKAGFFQNIGFVSVMGGKVFKKIGNIYNKTYNFVKGVVETVVETIKEKFLHFFDVHTDLQLHKVYQAFKTEQKKLGQNVPGVWNQLTINFLNDSFDDIIIKPDEVIYYEAEKNNPEYGEPGWQRISVKSAVRKYVAALNDSQYNEYILAKDDINELYNDAISQLAEYHYRDSHPEKAELFAEKDRIQRIASEKAKQHQKDVQQRNQQEKNLVAKYEKKAGVSEMFDDKAEDKSLQKDLDYAVKLGEKYWNEMLDKSVPGEDEMMDFIALF
jgi:hypothetical protein